MPTRTRTHRVALEGKIVAFAGRLSESHEEMAKFVKKYGGTVRKSVTKDCNLVVYAERDTPKVKEAKEKKKRCVLEKTLRRWALEATSKKASAKKGAKKKMKKNATPKKGAKKKTTPAKKKSSSKKKKSPAKKKKSPAKKKKSPAKKKKTSAKKKTKASPKKKAVKRKSSSKRKEPAKKPKLRRTISGISAKVDVVFSFDTTGSMMGVLTQVRKTVTESVKRMFQENPDVQIGIISHGDYCDGPNYLRFIDITDDEEAIVEFIKNAPSTGGGDAPEAYEQALRKGNDLTWREGSKRAFVLIGDEIPHEPSYPQNKDKTNWRNEVKEMKEQGITIYSVQAYNRGNSQKKFYQTIANQTGGYHLSLDQFGNASNMMMAIAFNEGGGLAAAAAFEKELQDSGEHNEDLKSIFDVILKRAGSTSVLTDAKLHAVSDATYEVIEVKNDASIRDFVKKHGLEFAKGKGFYQFTKKELVQEKKQIVIQDTNTGNFYTGTYARKMIGLNAGERKKVAPDDYEDLNIYIQSTSYNRKLKAGTMFLYEK